MKTILLFVTLFGVATLYTAEDYSGNVLYCDTPETELYYDDTHSFVALPQGTDFECGDWVIIRFADGTVIHSRVLDSGLFKDNCVIQPNGECLPVIVDIPSHIWPYTDGRISAQASVLNLSLLNRLLPPDSKVGYLRN